METLSEGSGGAGLPRGRGLVASEPQAERRSGCVGLPVFLRYGETSMFCSSMSVRSARNLGGYRESSLSP